MSTSRFRRLGASSALVLLGGGMNDVQTMLRSTGLGAAQVESLWWTMLGVMGVAWVATMSVLGWALLHRNSGREAADPEHVGTLTAPETEQEWRITRTIGGAVAVVALILIGVLGGSIWIERGIADETEEAPLVVDVIGHQWWWELHYRDAEGIVRVTTANELHLPARRPVTLRLRSEDVIHSFWIPNIAGKLDLIPGTTNTLRVRADEEGVFRGQCAEYCGLQHAKMGILAIVQSPQEFARWISEQRLPARPVADSMARRGRQVFLQTSCVLCHTVRGDSAYALVGPDLTHLASRRTIAAGVLPNIRGNLAGWIMDPQHIKPGSLMPPTNLDAADLHALLSYLESLK